MRALANELRRMRLRPRRPEIENPGPFAIRLEAPHGEVLVELLVEVLVVVVLVEVLVEVVEVRSAPAFSLPKRLVTAPMIVEKITFKPSKSSPRLRIKVALRRWIPSKPSIVYG